MKIEQYRLHEIEFEADEWEFIRSLLYIRYNTPVHILSVGGGNFSLEYAIATELERHLRSLFSIDVFNSYNKGDREFYNKRIVYSTLIGRGCEKTVAIQNDFFDQGVLEEIESNLSGERITLVLLEFVKSYDYITKVLKSIDHLLAEKYDIYFHNVGKNAESQSCFAKLSEGRRHIFLKNSKGIGVIKDIEGSKQEVQDTDPEHINNII